MLATRMRTGGLRNELYIYEDGDEFIPVSGGWYKSAGAGTLTKEATYLKLYAIDGQGISVTHYTAVNRYRYTKLSVRVAGAMTSSTFSIYGVSSDESTTVELAEFVESFGIDTYVIDIASYAWVQKVLFIGQTIGAGSTLTCSVHQVFFTP